MDDVQRLFRALVGTLSGDPERLDRAFEIAEIYQTIVPYRSHRSELQIDSIADYEMAVLRLLAGEQRLVELDPPEVREILRAEADAVHPDTSLFREFAGARVRLNGSAVAAVLGQNLRYAPPEAPSHHPTPAQEAQEAQEAREAQEAGEADSASSASPASAPPVFETLDDVDVPACPDCRADLPRGRTVVFCPYCARQLEPARCRVCGDEVEPGWQYCITCGNPMSG